MKELLIIAGSKSDEPFVEQGLKLCKEFGIEYEFKVYSAHRNLDALLEYLEAVEKNGKTKVIIAVAGLAAALPGVIAAKVKIPVIGVPCECGPLKGVDALISMVQMPKGVPVAVMAIGNAGMQNAVHFAKRILEVTC
ncbi:MAG: AIR carboxylase family protein [Heliobacteriaceae bacterium]|jgi:5-(carboxyamino)imidazole ribonucleotide mutase|nr:AIR carboxylase family protein [Heliobacteriaceae bacterium]